MAKKVYSIFKVTLFVDISSSVMIYYIVSWKLLEFCIPFFDFSHKNSILDPETLNFDETNPELSKIRNMFFSAVFVLTIPLFLKKPMDSL